MVSCANTNVNSISNKPTEDLLVACPKIQKDGSYVDFGGVWRKLDEVTDMYIECAKRHNSLIDYERRRVN